MSIKGCEEVGQEAMDCPGRFYVLNDVLCVLSRAMLSETDMSHRKELSPQAAVTPSSAQLPHISALTGNKALSLYFPGQQKSKLYFPSSSPSLPGACSVPGPTSGSFPLNYSLLFLSTSCLCGSVSL